MLFGEFVEAHAEIAANVDDIGQQLVENIEEFEGHAARERPAAEGGSMHAGADGGGSALIGGMGHGPRPLVGEDVSTREDLTVYQKLFVERCRIEVTRDETMRRPHTAAGKESYSTHASNRAKRYVEKRFLRDLYLVWRQMT